MKRIANWYGRYADGVDRLITWLLATPGRGAATAFVLLMGLGCMWAREPFRAIATGASLFDVVPVVGRNGLSYMPAWWLAVGPGLTIMAALAIPVYYLVGRPRDAAWATVMVRERPSRERRTPRRTLSKLAPIRVPGDAELWWTAIIAVLFGLTVAFPLWRAFESLSEGQGLSSIVNIAAWSRPVRLPLWSVFVYTGGMLWVGRRAFLALHRPSRPGKPDL